MSYSMKVDACAADLRELNRQYPNPLTAQERQEYNQKRNALYLKYSETDGEMSAYDRAVARVYRYIDY